MAHRSELILDIGTHKVLALAVQPTESGIEVLASSFVRHKARSMRDGQVHDVAAVAETVRRAVEQVSRAVGETFVGAHIAAAGRALKTSRGGAEWSEPHTVFITPEAARSLEWEAVADAQLQLLQSLPPHEQARGFYCIAHTVVESRLDGDVIASLAGQRGKLFSVEVLATFLPGVVVDSLETVLTEAGLEMHGLTLEPVAALEAVIPPTMRHLDLVLIDIGAGTSDIALTGNGMIQAFAMVPRGGDAITEAVSKAFLLDFHVAEQVKRIVSSGGPATVDNILGESVTISAERLSAAIEHTLETLVEHIARALGDWMHDTPPDAMLLVGGGSHTPGLPQALARRIGIDEHRVAVRDRKAVRDAVGEETLSGADAVTALGIALRASRGKEMPPVRVRLNDQPISLFQPDRCTVREAARIAGIPAAQLIGKPGPGITVTVNGEITAIAGQRGEPAAVYVNGEPATLDSQLHNQDEVTLKLPAEGAPPRLTVGDLAQQWLDRRTREGNDRPHIMLNGVRQPLPLRLKRNGRPARPEDVIQDRDVIDIRFIATAAELLTAHGESPVGSCTVNDRVIELSQFATMTRNGAAARPIDPVNDGDVWELHLDTPVTVGQLLERIGTTAERTIRVVLNGAPTHISVPADVTINGRPATPADVVANGDRIQVRPAGRASLYQILPYAGISTDDMTTNGKLVLLVRGQRAGFTTPVSDGDEITIRYE